MFGKIRRKLRELSAHTSGNAVIMVAVGLPSLIGASGLAVDTAQWYMWQRELQFAADQAALAGAWARTNSASQSTYQSRAAQEYSNNMQLAGDFDSTPVVSLVNYNGGSSNAVQVTASATKTLPFSSILTGQGVTVAVKATATVTPGQAGETTTTTLEAVSACMVALHPTAQGALTLGGSASGTVACGGATLSSDADAAIEENGNPSALFGSLTATGGIETSLNNNILGADLSKIKPNQTGLADPFTGLAAPTGNGVARTYSCPTASAGTTTTTANVTTLTQTEYRYFVGSNGNASTVLTPTPTTAATGYLANPADSTVGPASQTVSSSTTAGTFPGSWVRGTAVQIGGSGSSKKYRVPYTKITTTYANVNTVTTGGNDGIARPQPGTYGNISIACTTYFNPGIYVVNGQIDFSNNRTVTGSDVMFVFTAANDVSNINSNTNITLSGITAATLTSSYGYSVDNANKLAGMLFYDPFSTSEIKWNGNSQTIYNGTLYMPNRPLWFNGTASVSGRCMMLVASTLMFTGTIDLSSFCQTGGAANLTVRPETTVTTTTPATQPVVKLVV
jgi:Flp pilus assembly protein TadG